MDKTNRCEDLGYECAFTACAQTETELFQKVLGHVRTVHRVQEFSPGFYRKVRASIQEGYCDLEDKLCDYGQC